MGVNGRVGGITRQLCNCSVHKLRNDQSVTSLSVGYCLTDKNKLINMTCFCQQTSLNNECELVEGG